MTPFRRVAFLGIGLIGASMARGMRAQGLMERGVALSRRHETLQQAMDLGLVEEVTDDPAAVVEDADLVVFCVPVGAMGALAEAVGPHLAPGALVTDVGSVKQGVVAAMAPHMPAHVDWVPGHPIAGTEHSGPAAGFAELFQGRWAIITPLLRSSAAGVDRLKALWEALGSKVAVMDPKHHDHVLAITSHLPHLIAYTIVDTAVQLGDDLREEVIAYSASGFRDFTRIAASDPVMWRDVFLNNREAVLEMLQRFNEDLTALQSAIRRGDGAALEAAFTRTRDIRRGIIDANQA